MRTRSARGLTTALGAGAALVVLAGAPSLASQADGVTCDTQTFDAGQPEVQLPSSYASILDEGESFVSLTVQAGGDSKTYESPAYDTPLGAGGGNVTGTVLCWGPTEAAAGDDAGEDDGVADETTDDGAADDGASDDTATDDTATDEGATEDDATEDGADEAAGPDDSGSDDVTDDSTDESATEEDADDATDGAVPTGPAVETDGPATAGVNLGLIGGAALALVGAGAVGVALRRKSLGH
ncbi:hypothetical protein [Ornithinimicrobium sp. Y1694]|uniref:hypothetical protein n=1 Tax=Ornithinimicrobium sp. Y1694 TaxID=3418590 RepID=UPI003CF63F49